MQVESLSVSRYIKADFESIACEKHIDVSLHTTCMHLNKSFHKLSIHLLKFNRRYALISCTYKPNYTVHGKQNYLGLLHDAYMPQAAALQANTAKRKNEQQSLSHTITLCFHTEGYNSLKFCTVKEITLLAKSAAQLISNLYPLLKIAFSYHIM